MVSAVTAMCSAAHGPEGITLDEEAQNARFDLKAARFVYSQLQAQRDVRFTVVTRHSAAACRLPRNSLNGSLHPVAKRLAATGPTNLQARRPPHRRRRGRATRLPTPPPTPPTPLPCAGAVAAGTPHA